MSLGEDFEKFISFSHHNIFISSKQQYLLNLMIKPDLNWQTCASGLYHLLHGQSMGKWRIFHWFIQDSAQSKVYHAVGTWYSSASEPVKHYTSHILMREKKCFHTGHLLRTCHTCYNLYESCAAPQQKIPHC